MTKSYLYKCGLPKRGVPCEKAAIRRVNAETRGLKGMADPGGGGLAPFIDGMPSANGHHGVMSLGGDPSDAGLSLEGLSLGSYPTRQDLDANLGPALTQPNLENKLFVGGAPPGTDEDTLKRIFEEHGDVEEVFLMRGGSRSGQACAFVRFVSPEGAIAAIQAVHGKYVMPGCTDPLVVRYADAPGSRTKKKGPGGAYGGFGPGPYGYGYPGMGGPPGAGGWGGGPFGGAGWPGGPGMGFGGYPGAAAWSKCPLGSAPARLLCLLTVHLAALGGSALPGRGPATVRPSTASFALASRLQSRRFHRL